MPALAAAQANPDSIKHRNNCRLAEQVASTGKPATKREWALPYLSGCGRAGGMALATAIDRERTSTDVESLEQLYMPASVLHDRAIFQTVMEVAADKEASVPARALSLGTLLRYENLSYDAGYEALIGTSVAGAGCHLLSFGPIPPRALVGIPLPSDYLERSRTLAEQIATDMTEPKEVRHAAGCVLEGLERLGP